MIKTTKSYYCDICKNEVKNADALTCLQVPVFYHFDDTDFSICKPYVQYADLDLCSKCLEIIVKLHSYTPGSYELRS